MQKLNRRTFLKQGIALGLMSAFPSFAQTSVTGKNWLSRLSNYLLLSDLTIPATHDSAARYGGGLFQTQNFGIEEQLNSGVRYLDLRLALKGGKNGEFRLHHGNMDMRISFIEVLNIIKRFLEQNPTETVMISLKQEHTTFDDPTMGRAYQRHIKNFRSLIYDSYDMPSLGEVRGKIVVVTRCLGIPGISYRLAKVSDVYKINTSTQWHNSKWPAVKEHLLAAHDSSESDSRLWIATVSSTGALLHPYGASKLMNPHLKRFFEDRQVVPAKKWVRFGVILMDYVDENIVKHIYMLNFNRLS